MLGEKPPSRRDQPRSGGSHHRAGSHRPSSVRSIHCPLRLDSRAPALHQTFAVKILCLFVRHGLGRYPNALSDLDAWYNKQGLLKSRLLWIIDNSLPQETPPKEIAPAVILRPGDNHAWEFSGWASALDDAREVSGVDVVHFVTSAFNTLYTKYLEHFRPDMIPFVATRRVCLGHIDSYPTPVSIRGASSSSWIRTCFFFLSRDLAFAPRPWVAFDKESEIFLDNATRRFRPDAPLSVDYQDRINHWLEGRVQGGYQWHSAIGGGAEEVRRFRLKSLAILNEHQLTIQFRSEGIAPTDFCWLWAVGANEPIGRWPQNAPEAEQLRVRRRILGIPE